jgi:hypothetical protein
MQHSSPSLSFQVPISRAPRINGLICQRTKFRIKKTWNERNHRPSLSTRHILIAPPLQCFPLCDQERQLTTNFHLPIDPMLSRTGRKASILCYPQAEVLRHWQTKDGLDRQVQRSSTSLKLMATLVCGSQWLTVRIEQWH